MCVYSDVCKETIKHVLGSCTRHADMHARHTAVGMPHTCVACAIRALFFSIICALGGHLGRGQLPLLHVDQRVQAPWLPHCSLQASSAYHRQSRQSGARESCAYMYIPRVWQLDCAQCGGTGGGGAPSPAPAFRTPPVALQPHLRRLRNAPMDGQDTRRYEVSAGRNLADVLSILIQGGTRARPGCELT